MMTLKRTTAIAATVLSLSLFGAGRADAGCFGLAFSSDQNSPSKKFDSTFSASRVLDVDLWPLFKPGVLNRYKGDHELEVRIFTPRGFLYQSITIPFSSDTAKKGTSRRVEGYPAAVATGVLQEITTVNGKEYGTRVRLPIGGTMITNSSLYGAWSVDVLVDGDAVPCAKRATFTITE